MKPLPQYLEYYNFYAAFQYVSNKYKIEISLVDFMYWLVSHLNGMLNNDSYVTLNEEFMKGNDYELVVVRLVLDEFGSGEPGKREVNFWISW